MRRHGPNGFTLLELIVVITIIGILGALVVMNTSGASEAAKQMAATHDVQMIYNAAEAYYNQVGRWPDSPGQLRHARHPVTGDPIGGMLRDVPDDPWGNPYVFEMGDDGPVLTSYGRDGAAGGEGPDRDIRYPRGDYLGGE